MIVTVHLVALYWGFGYHTRRRGVRVTLATCLPVCCGGGSDKSVCHEHPTVAPHARPSFSPATDVVLFPAPCLLISCCTFLRTIFTTRRVLLLLPLSLLLHRCCCLSSFVRWRNVWMANLGAYLLVCSSAFPPPLLVMVVVQAWGYEQRAAPDHPETRVSVRAVA